MKTTLSMILIALFAVGCSSSSQTSVESPLDHVETGDEIKNRSHRAQYFETHEGLHFEFEESVTSSEMEEAASAAESAQVAAIGAIEIPEDASAEGLVGTSWSDPENERLYLAVTKAAGFAERDLAPIAHFRRGSRHVVISWPVVTSEGALAGSAIYGICVEEYDDGTYDSCAEPWRVNEVTSSTEMLDSALGGPDYEIVSHQLAMPLVSIGETITTLGNAFVSAASTGDRDELFRSAQELMQILPPTDAAFDNSLPQLLVTAAREGKEFVVPSTETGGDLFATVTFRVSHDLLGVTARSLTAQQIDGTNDWRIVDYW